MRKLLVFSAVLAGMFIGFQSCSKQSAHEMIAAPLTDNIINATISANQSYQLVLDNSASVSIAKQASHFQISQTELDTKSGSLLYRYVPANNYSGTDEVVIGTTKTMINGSTSECYNNNYSNQNSNNISYSTSYTTIKIKITN